MTSMRNYWILGVIAAFFLGAGADRAFNRSPPVGITTADDRSKLAGFERLHQLDERITVLNDPKALQAEWTNDAVRLSSNAAADIGREAIYTTDVRSFTDSPGFAIVSYKPDIRDLQVAGEWAFEWGLFSAGYRSSAAGRVEEAHGKVLRILHRESSGEWKFARVMVSLNAR